MVEKRVLINPLQGNAPYLMGAGISMYLQEEAARHGDSLRVIMPKVYDGQAGLLDTKGFRNMELDTVLGGIAKQLWFSGHYANHVHTVVAKRGRTEKDMQDYLSRQYGLFDAEISTGARMRSGAPSFYVFPYVPSELMRASKQDAEPSRSFGSDGFALAEEVLAPVDEAHTLRFVPRFHTLYGRTSRLPTVVTPPLSPIQQPPKKDIPEGSMYIVLSGTGQDVESLIAEGVLAKRHGTHVMVSEPTGRVNTHGLDIEQTNMIFHPHVRTVRARAGFGTIWDCMQASKQFVAEPYRFPDDVEILYNIQAVRAKSPHAAAAEDRVFFPTMNGLAYVADQIAERMWGRSEILSNLSD